MKKKYLFILSLLFSLSVYSQNNSSQNLSVFIDGWIVDFDYIRNDVTFVDFVSDSKIADVHVIVRRTSTGGGGSEYTLAYYGNDFRQMVDITLSCFTYSFESHMQIREKLATTLKSGLMPYLQEKNGASSVSITQKIINSDEEDKADEGDNGITTDKWRNWVFRIGLEGGINGEEQKQNLDYSIDLKANKITDLWKIETEYDFYRRERTITNIDNGVEEVIHNTILNKDLDFSFVYSLSERWSMGMFFQGKQSTYRNNKMALEFIPALQYNFFLWSEIDRRSFTVTYKIGPSYNEYYETTIFEKDNEWLWNENIEIRFEKVETWGDIEIWLEGGHYFPDFEKYYYEAGIDLAFRISKGFSFTVKIQAENVHNQIYLPESELSLEDLLLNIRKPPTSFEYSSKIGIRFQFGSFYNNVVNERLN